MNFERDTRKLKKMLRDDGFKLLSGGATQDHERWVKGSRRVSVPRTKEVKYEATIRNIYKQAGWL
ncbi:MAG: type II toxin-antitoxin system HicA family toxin [Coriobacteriia bacterium]|nr:type II toxin-antitoxin system HicA family toxin [Coriobacteriia bacterium]